MNSIIALVISLSYFVIATAADRAKANCSCLCVIRKLAWYDHKLGGRASDKADLAQLANSSADFVDQLERKQKHPAEDFSSEGTASWVAETFQGLEPQFDEYRNAKNVSASGYANLIGHDIISLFEKHKSSPKRVILKARHVGITEHSLVIEQVPASESGAKGVGYRIYQSYDNAHSLRAWLAKTLPVDIYTHDGGDIVLNPFTLCGVQDKTDDSPLCQKYRPRFNVLKDVQSFLLSPISKFVKFVESSTLETAKEDNRFSADQFGWEQLLNETEFFGNYLAKTAEITAYFNANAKSEVPFNNTIYNYWLSLYGAPNLGFIPDAPFDILAKLFKKTDYSAGYGFEVKATPLVYGDAEEWDARCRKNAYVLKDSFST